MFYNVLPHLISYSNQGNFSVVLLAQLVYRERTFQAKEMQVSSIHLIKPRNFVLGEILKNKFNIKVIFKVSVRVWEFRD